MLVALKAASTLRASVRFAAALCEISGSFFLFVPPLCVGNHTQRSAFSSWLRGPSHPPAPDPNAKVTAAANFLLVVGHEDRKVCRLQRSERSVSAFCSGRDGHYADRVFAFANSVLTALLKQQSRRRYAANGFAFVPNPCRFLGQQSLGFETGQ